MLLEREDVSPNSADKGYRTPLSWAAGDGHGDIVEMLLEREDVAPGTADKYDGTPLSWAARNWCGGIMEMLLGRGIALLTLLTKKAEHLFSGQPGMGMGTLWRCFQNRRVSL